MIYLTYATRSSGLGHLMRARTIFPQAVRAVFPQARLVVIGDDAAAAVVAAPENKERFSGSVSPVVLAPDLKLAAALLASTATNCLICDLPTDIYQQFAQIWPPNTQNVPAPQLVFFDNSTASALRAGTLINILPYPIGTSLPTLPPSTRLYTGFKYYPLVSPTAKSERSAPPVAEQVLITMGGSDPADITAFMLPIVESLAAIKQITVVLGGGYQGAINESNSGERVTVLRAQGSLAALIASCDLCLTAAPSLTLYECAAAGRAAVGVAPYSFHHSIAKVFAQRGTMLYLGERQALSAEQAQTALQALLGDQLRRTQYAVAGAELIDGRGLERIREILRSVPC